MFFQKFSPLPYGDTYKLFLTPVQGLTILRSFFPSVLWSFRPFGFLSGSFLGIGSLVFSGTQHGVRGLCVAVRDRAGFKEQNFVPKLGQMGQK